MKTSERDEISVFEDDDGMYLITWKRWLVLAVVILINMSVAMVWLSFSPVAYKVASYYGAELIVINILSLVFLITGIPGGLLVIWIMERYGLRVCILICAWCACIGSVLRIASTIEGLTDDEKLGILFAGQFIVAFGCPFGTYTPPKLASSWFPDSQRTVANTLATSANPFGIILTGLISPLFQESESYYDVRTMLITYSAPCVAGAIAASLFVTTDGPIRPPSESNDNNAVPQVWKGVKEVARNKMFMLLALCLGTGLGLFSVFATLMEQFLCPWGYSDTMAGISSSVLTASGIVGSILISPIADKTKKFAEILKAVYFLTALASILLSLTHDIYIGYWITAEVVLIGFFAFTIYPVGTEIAAECTYPIGTGTSTGIIQLSGQVQSVLLILVMSVIGRPMEPEEVIANNSQCHHNTTSIDDSAEDVTLDMRVSTYICAGLTTFVAMIVAIFFHPTYKRMEAEKQQKLDYYNKRRQSQLPTSSDIEKSFTNEAFETSKETPTSEKVEDDNMEKLDLNEPMSTQF